MIMYPSTLPSWAVACGPSAWLHVRMHSNASSEVALPAAICHASSFIRVLCSETDGAAKVAANRRHAAKRKGELHKAIDAAAASPAQHAAIHGWQV
jgi:hypothetical protein